MTTMTSTWVWQDAATGTTYLDTITSSMSLVSLGSTTTMGDYPMPAIGDLIDSD